MNAFGFVTKTDKKMLCL